MSSKSGALSSSPLQELIRSKEQGHVVGIWSSQFSNGVCLTVVDDIQPIDVTNDHLITLRKTDLQGRAIRNPKILLSEIRKVTLFNSIYNEHLLLNPIDDYYEESSVKIRTREQSVDTDDLKIIMIRNVNSGSKIKIKQTNNREVKACFVKEYDPHRDAILFSCDLNDTKLEEISLTNIEEIEFEFYFPYKGIASKKFLIRENR